MGYKLADGSLSTDYKIGDEFVVGETDKGQTFAVGSVVKLKKDDKSRNPRFKLFSGECLDDFLGNGECFFNWSSLRAVKKKPFTKSDLKDGMRVELRDGCVHYVCGAEGYCPGDGSTVDLTEYSEDFNNTGSGDEKFDIIRVTDRDGAVLFEREPEKVKLELEVTPEQAEAIRKQLGR